MDAKDGLTQSQIEEMEQELRSELVRLERSIGHSQKAAEPVKLDQASVGRLSRMDAITSQQMSIDLLSREQSRHALIMDALARIAAGSYGQCVHCEAHIPYGRLLVMPEARTCAACVSRGG